MLIMEMWASTVVMTARMPLSSPRPWSFAVTDPVSGPVLPGLIPLANSDRVRPELAGLEEPGAGGVVEVGDIGAAHRQHHHPIHVTVACCVVRAIRGDPEVVVDDPVGEPVRGRGVHPAVRGVRGHGGIGVPGPQVGPGRGVPSLRFGAGCRSG
jgi:hypothetical protein